MILSICIYIWYIYIWYILYIILVVLKCSKHFCFHAGMMGYPYTVVSLTRSTFNKSRASVWFTGPIEQSRHRMNSEVLHGVALHQSLGIYCPDCNCTNHMIFTLQTIDVTFLSLQVLTVMDLTMIYSYLFQIDRVQSPFCVLGTNVVPPL